MFCRKCGKEIEENSLFCTFCGTEQGAEIVAEQSSAATVFHSVCASNDFHLLTLFYLISSCASALASVASGVMPLPIIQIFIIIALFKLEKLAKQNAPLADFASPLKTFRVIIKIYQVICWVLVGIFAVCGVIMVAFGGAFATDISNLFVESADYADIFGGIAAAVIGIIFIVVAVITAILTIAMYGPFYKTAESAELSAKTGDIYIASLSQTRTWLIVSAVLSGISALSSLGSGVAGVLGFVGAGFSVAFTVFAIKALDNIKNYRQNGIL